MIQWEELKCTETQKHKSRDSCRKMNKINSNYSNYLVQIVEKWKISIRKDGWAKFLKSENAKSLNFYSPGFIVQSNGSQNVVLRNPEHWGAREDCSMRLPGSPWDQNYFHNTEILISVATLIVSSLQWSFFMSDITRN